MNSLSYLPVLAGSQSKGHPLQFWVYEPESAFDFPAWHPGRGRFAVAIGIRGYKYACGQRDGLEGSRHRREPRHRVAQQFVQ